MIHKEAGAFASASSLIAKPNSARSDGEKTFIVATNDHRAPQNDHSFEWLKALLSISSDA